MAFPSAASQLKTRLSVQKKALRYASPKGTAPKSKRSPMAIMTGIGKASTPTMGYASKSKYSVSKPIKGGLGVKSKGKMKRATGYH